MLALTQCWYTRTHVPEGRGHRDDDDTWSANCRYCERPIIRRGGAGHAWRLADGIDLAELAEAAGTRFLYLLDVTDDLVVARFLLNQCHSEEEIAAYRARLQEQYQVDAPGSRLVLRDSSDRR